MIQRTTRRKRTQQQELQESSSTTTSSGIHSSTSSTHDIETLSIVDRRNFIRDIILTCAIVTTTATSYPSNAYALFGVPAKEDPKPKLAADITGAPILYEKFVEKHKPNQRVMVQGLKGDPTYLILSKDGTSLETYALNAECSHLGCIVPWDENQNKFICPCHGSTYDSKGSVIRGPAPSSLKLAKVLTEEETGKVLLEPWTDDDFRSGEKPWWI
jgi:cytochrome b6-f complex iron-sulfur subunit